MNKGNIMRKLLRQPASNNESVDTSFSGSPQLRPSASQNTLYSAGAPIACLDRSPDGNHAVIAGSKVFKTVKVDGPTITEDIDLRAIITSYANSHDASAASADRLSIKSVAWSHSAFDTTIFTACTNGRVTVYDLNKLGEGLEVARIHDHTRQVHKLSINPFREHLLLSASQDGNVKMFDIRNRAQGRNGLILKTFQNYKCNADAVRDVSWSPKDGFEFACSTDAGIVQKWDSRKATAPVLKFTAHTKACISISWHPDGEHIVSGGMDQRCHVWDFSKRAERNQKPKYSFDTPAPVSSVSWRPACWSHTAQGRRAAQVTVSYDDTNSNKNQNASVHIWDLARPGMPFKEIEQWDSAPTGLLWSTRDLLWSVDRDGHFKQTDVAFVPKLIDRRSLSTFSFSANGDILMILEQRRNSRRPPPTLSPSDVPTTYEKLSSNGPQLSVSRSDSEEDVVGSFLGPMPKKTQGRHGSRSNHYSISNVAPTSSPSRMEGTIMSLDEAVQVTGQYVPQQVVAIGHAPSTARRSLYQYLTNRYLMRLAKTRLVTFNDQTPDVLLSSTMEHFAETAQNVGHYRLAQTWRILGYTMNLLLTRRAQHHRESRLAAPRVDAEQEDNNEPKESRDRGEETPRRFPSIKPPFDSSPINPASRSIIAEEMESTSNVATPRVGPVLDPSVQERNQTMRTSMGAENNVENDVLDLPPPSLSKPDPIDVPRADQSTKPQSSEEGYDFYGLDSFPPAINFHVPQKKQPLRLDYPDHNGSPHRMQVTRHDSGESFEMFSTSGDSHAHFTSSAESDMALNEGRERDQSLREAVASWENSFNSSLRHRSSTDSEVMSPSGAITPDSSNDGGRHALPMKRASPPALLLQEASIRPNEKAEEPRREDHSLRPSLSDQTSHDPNFIESDYLPWPNDPHFILSPIDPTVLIERTIQFEVQTGVLNASAIILSLGSLLPPKALDPIQTAAILRQYHRRLQNMKLFTEATLFRNLCVPSFPSVWEDTQSDINTGYFCTDCNKPLDNDPMIPGSMWRCPRCQQAIDGCAVCRHREADTTNLTPACPDSETEVQELLLWWICPGCGHGGHTACMRAWHESPPSSSSSPTDGCCPLEGCLHPCLPGPWREQREAEKRALREKEFAKMVRESGPKGRSVSAHVRRDTREVNQSRAVEGVRIALALGGQGPGPGVAGIDRRRSVKVVAPGEER